ncbi:cytidylyltransferase domain-containing protein [Alkalibacillus aidingensis]|uniref:cytidylyltransferase domain-containing protein n=1 Tax=Alkalibacillus aidingensis TaxID=2747607 RepID=UPI00166148B9|nr:glycosyltransferase family protein [Alkalibacillus aidingensis]
MRVTAIIQARMSSTRLPGKVLKAVLNRPLLHYQLDRLQRASMLDEVVVATTENSTDDAIVDFCQQVDIPVYRGSKEDVLSRYVEAARFFNADVIVRLTSDCPVIDPVIVDRIVQCFRSSKSDYVSNTMIRTYPRGMDTEVLNQSTLETLHQKATTPTDREHVTSYMLKHLNEFDVEQVKHKEDLSHYRWTVDTPEDFELIKRIIEHIYPTNSHFTMEDILDLLKEHPSWVNINAHIEQKRT